MNLTGCPGPFRVISFGGGVQSSAMLLMGLDGMFGDIPGAAVFSDTKGEPSDVYDWIEFMRQEVAPFPIHVCSFGSLIEGVEAKRMKASIPWHSTKLSGGHLLMPRFCTTSYKIEPFQKMARKLAPKRAPIETWIGISTDEAHRMKPSRNNRFTHRWPLIELGMSRDDCIAYVQAKTGFTPPRSACWFCPFKADNEWQKMKQDNPDLFSQACAFDEAHRESHPKWGRDRYLHKSLLPLSQVDFSGEGKAKVVDQFGNECEGMCGN